MKFTINEKEVDFSIALPLKNKDWKALKAIGITQELISSGDLEALSKYILFIFNKSNPAVTIDDIDELTDLETLTIFKKIKEFLENGEDRNYLKF